MKELWSERSICANGNMILVRFPNCHECQQQVGWGTWLEPSLLIIDWQNTNSLLFRVLSWHGWIYFLFFWEVNLKTSFGGDIWGDMGVKLGGYGGDIRGDMGMTSGVILGWHQRRYGGDIGDDMGGDVWYITYMSGASSRACLGHVWDIIWVMALLLYYGELLCLIICREFWLILMARRNSIRASCRKRKILGLVVVLVDKGRIRLWFCQVGGIITWMWSPRNPGLGLPWN